MKAAIIPARGGSKRIPRKNLVPIMGKPLLLYPLEAAQKSRVFDEVIVSTEDEEIARVAGSVGARIIPRPLELAQDRVSMAKVCVHVLDVLKGEGREPEFFCCVLATALFLQPHDFEESFRVLCSDPPAETVLGVSKFNLAPLQAFRRSGDYLEPMWPEYLNMESQFHPPLVASNGTLCWARTPVFRSNEDFYGHKMKGYELSWIRGVDINTEEELGIAQVLFSYLHSKDAPDRLLR